MLYITLHYKKNDLVSWVKQNSEKKHLWNLLSNFNFQASQEGISLKDAIENTFISQSEGMEGQNIEWILVVWSTKGSQMSCCLSIFFQDPLIFLIFNSHSLTGWGTFNIDMCIYLGMYECMYLCWCVNMKTDFYNFIWIFKYTCCLQI